MITLQQDGNAWGAFECHEEYPDCDAAFAPLPADALKAIIAARPDLDGEQVIRWEDGHWWSTIADAITEFEGVP